MGFRSPLIVITLTRFCTGQFATQKYPESPIKFVRLFARQFQPDKIFVFSSVDLSKMFIEHCDKFFRYRKQHFLQRGKP